MAASTASRVIFPSAMASYPPGTRGVPLRALAVDDAPAPSCLPLPSATLINVLEEDYRRLPLDALADGDFEKDASDGPVPIP